MPVRRILVGTGVLLVAAVFGLFVLWAFAKGTANAAEQLCLDDSIRDPSYGGYSMDGSLWPPSFECTVQANGRQPIVFTHPGFAHLLLTLAIIVPVTYLAATGFALWWAVKPVERASTHPARRDTPARRAD